MILMTGVRAAGSARGITLTGLGIFLLTSLALIYCVWSLGRGFEITDEAYYLLLAKNTDPSMLYISAQQWITGPVWRLCGEIYLFRAVGLVILIVCSGVLATGVCIAAVKFNFVSGYLLLHLVVAAGSILGALLYCSTINSSPSYNLIASAAAYLAAGCCLIALCAERTKPFKALLYIVAGFAIGVEFVCKASAGISTWALLVFWLCAFERSFVHSTVCAAVLTLSAAIFVILLLLANTSFGAAQSGLTQGMALFRIVQSEAVSTRLIRYLHQYWDSALACFSAFALPLLSCLAYSITRQPVLLKLCVLSLMFALVSGGHLIGGWRNPHAYPPPYAIFAILTILLLGTISYWGSNVRVVLLLLGLVALPYTVAMGTGNALFTQVVVSMSPWATIVALLAMSSFPHSVPTNEIRCISVMFLATIALQIVTSGKHPYNLALPLNQQNRMVSIPGVGILKVDTDTERFLEDVRRAVERCQVAPGTPFLGLYNIPGVALAMQAEPIMTPWLNNVAQANFVIDRAPQNLINSAIIAINYGGALDQPPLPKHLASFPSGYTLCGFTVYPFANQKIEIWKPEVTPENPQ